MSLLQKTLLTQAASLAKELTLANKLTPKREPVPDRHTPTEIEDLARTGSWISQQKHNVPSLQQTTTRVSTYDLILSAVSSLLNSL